MTSKDDIQKRRQVWADALLDGHYKQGRSYIKRGDEYCCLGVACDVYKDLVPGGEWVSDNQDFGVYAFRAKDESNGEVYTEENFLPHPVAEFFGLTSKGDLTEFVHLKNEHGQINSEKSLAGLNDGGATFEEIAGLLVHESELFKRPGEG